MRDRKSRLYRIIECSLIARTNSAYIHIYHLNQSNIHPNVFVVCPIVQCTRRVEKSERA